jgi:PBSX family phage terminase large subunit
VMMLMTGSAGGGKSRCAAEKVNAFMLKYPGATGLMLRKAREYAGKSIVPFMEKAVIGGTSGTKKKKSDSLFQYQNGSMLYWGGMKDDSQREGIRSIGPDGSLDIVWIEEATQFTELDLNELLARMRGHVAPWVQIILTTNPDAPSHWINQRLILGGEATVYYSRAADNPNNPPRYLETLKLLTGILRERLVLGLWKQAEGAVYEWDPELHLCDPFTIPSSWRRFICIDFGYTNPFVCQWWAVDPDGVMYRYRELYRTRRTVDEHADQILELSRGEDIEIAVCDHDAEDRATLEKKGIATIPAMKDISTGIQAVGQRMAKDERTDLPRVRFFRSALVEEDEALVEAKKPTCTEQEFPGYVWPKGQDGKTVKEVPVKVNDHGMDTTRYAVKYVDEGEGGIEDQQMSELGHVEDFTSHWDF